ncbi:hypothetical protein GEV33_001331 [Tenebrio molitor]|uniref:Uncharacterized protein n=1 Tax=Tenebrio molitor TaxID=7067 RepID=A0A8J6HVF0_TENMO|nr:hypothetical protein GEV33_001331 [Tenebrio molitor]
MWKNYHSFGVNAYSQILSLTYEMYSDDETLEECDDYYIETTSPARGTPDSLATQIRTGLTQSDTSLTGERHSYCYTNQQCYDNGSYGYQTYNGYVNDEPLQRLKDNNKPKITAAVYKTRQKTTDEADEDAVQEEQMRLGNSIGKRLHISDNKQNDISLSGTAEPDEDYENKGFD